MQKREKLLALTAAATILVWLGLPRMYDVFFGPIDDSRSRLQSVNGQLAQTTKTAARLNNARQLLKQWRGRSLPPDPRDAQRLYQVWLTDLAQMSDVDKLTVTPGRIVPKGDVYTGVLVTVGCEARLSQLSRFLYHFYRIDLPHRIVGITIDSSDNRGDPKLSVLLTAEGLALSGMPERKLLFPQTRLKDGFRSGTGLQTIEVADVTGFPAGPGFRVRIGNEYLTVTAVEKSTWTVRGGVDATTPGRHNADDVVELAPVHPNYRDSTVEDFQRLAENSPFTKPAPVRVATPTVRPSRNTTPSRRPTTPVARRDNSAAETYLAASVFEDDVPQAWLYRRSTSVQTRIRQGAELNVGEVQAVVREIAADYVLLEKKDGDLWKLELGDDLLSMRKLPRPENPVPDPGEEPKIEPNGGQKNELETVPEDAPVEAPGPPVASATPEETDVAAPKELEPADAPTSAAERGDPQDSSATEATDDE